MNPMMRPRCTPAGLLLLGLTLLLPGCSRDKPEQQTAPPPADSTARGAAVPVVPEGLSPTPETPPAKPDAGLEGIMDIPEPVKWDGPLFAVARSSVGIYAQKHFDRKSKLGYVRRGGHLPIKPGKTSADNCRGGWYEVAAGGYVCGSYGTTNLNDPKVRLETSQPKIQDILPYRYARNAKNGTPLYKSVPSKQQMEHYEPYLNKGKKRAKFSAKRPAIGYWTATADAGAPKADAAPPPWWRRENPKLHEIKLADLESEADDILAQRMVKGFYVAVDRIFKWQGRTWYRTTKGMVAPADRFWVTKGSDFKGVELTGDWKLPVGWTYGWKKLRPRYSLQKDGKQLKPAGSVKRFEAVALTGEEKKIGGKTFLETRDGHWMRAAHLRVTKPGPMPEKLADKERWIDVNLSQQTLIVYLGRRPVYATMVSSGKESKIKEKDHRTPRGEWRIREKHIASTMDGDGTAAGDLPYRIEDVPYVMYFHKAYALHGAFWHQNYGVRMSHGCINLAPLDAKHIFMFTNPQLAPGWHGSWAQNEQGSRVVVHD